MDVNAPITLIGASYRDSETAVLDFGTVWASRHEVDSSSADEWEAFYSTSHACLRSSDLGKRYGWGIHADPDGRLAVYAVGSDAYASLAAGVAPDGSPVTVTAAMRSARR